MLFSNSDIEVRLDDTNGSITRLKDLRISKDYISKAEFARLFRLIVPSGNWQGRHINSWDQKVKGIERKGEREVTIIYESLLLGVDEFKIKAVVSLKLEGENINLRISLENNGKDVITDVIFPWLSGVGEAKDVKTDAFYLPASSSAERKIKSPIEAIGGVNHFPWNRASYKRSFRYPNQLATSWVDYGCEDYGLGMEVRNRDIQPQDFYVEKLVEKDKEDIKRNKIALSFGWCFFPHVKLGEVWTSPEIIIKLHEGDWHVVADKHRRWSEGWMIKPDVPADFARSLGWHFYFMKHQDGTIINTYEDFSKMAEGSLKAGIPNIMVFGWQRVGHDNYYPFGYYANEDWGGKEKLKEKLDQVRKMGVRVIPFFNATLLDTSTPEYEQYAHKWAVKSRTGGMYFGGDWSRSNFDVPVKLCLGLGSTNKAMLCCDICPDSESLPWALETARRIVTEYGFSNLQLDQIAHKMYLCYNQEHKHEKPQYASIRGYTKLLKNIRKMLREHNPDGVMIGEGFTDFAAQYCDSHWNWNQLDFPEILRYSLPWFTYSHEIDANEYGDVNRCFLYKIMLDLKIDGGDGYVSSYPKFCEHLKKLSELKKRLDDIYTFAYFRDEDGIDYSPRNSVVMAKAYKNEKKNKVGIVIVNCADKGEIIELSIGISSKCKDYTLYRLDGGVEVIPRKDTLQLNFSSYDVQVVGIGKVVEQ